MSNLSELILVKMAPSEPDFVSISIFDIIHGRSLRFLVTKTNLIQLTALDQPDPVIDTDIGSYIQISRMRSTVHFKLTWLHMDSRNEVTGYIHSFSIPIEKVREVVRGQSITHLEKLTDRKPKASLIFTDSGYNMVRRSCQDKLNRHALKKFFRDNFNYGREERLIIYPDNWIRGFYFQSCNDSYAGGIVRHEGTVTGRDGQEHKKVYYAVHT